MQKDLTLKKIKKTKTSGYSLGLARRLLVLGHKGINQRNSWELSHQENKSKEQVSSPSPAVPTGHSGINHLREGLCASSLRQSLEASGEVFVQEFELISTTSTDNYSTAMQTSLRGVYLVRRTLHTYLS